MLARPRPQVLLSALALVLGIVVLAAPPASAADRVINDEPSCVAAGGQYDDRGICTFERLTVGPADTLRTTILVAFGDLTVQGRLEISSGSLSNTDTLVVGPAGTVVLSGGSRLRPYGNTSNNGTITIGAATSFIPLGGLTNSGRIDNAGALEGGGVVVNQGVITATCAATFDVTVTGNPVQRADCTGPIATISQGPGQDDPTTLDPILFVVDFGEAVTGFDASDTTVSGSGVASAPTVVPVNAQQYQVRVSGITRPGTFVLGVRDGAVTDQAGNPSTTAAGGDRTVTFAATSISGTVYADTDRNGSPGAGEPGIPGVALTLLGSSSRGLPVSAQTTSGPDGSWSFGALLAGAYTVHETQPPTYDDGADTPGAPGTVTGNDAVQYVLGAGATSTGTAFGELAPSGLFAQSGSGQRVELFNDVAAPLVALVQDVNSRPVAGVLVTFTIAAPGAGDGDATFGVGGRTVTVTTGADGLATTTPAIRARQPGPVRVTATGPRLGTVSYDLTVQPLGSISGRVVVDRNRDGVGSPGEAGIAGVRIDLAGTTSSGSQLTGSQVTGADGSFTFSGTFAGTYTLTETQPAAYDDGAETAGTSATVSGPDQVRVVLPVSQDLTGTVFAELPRPVAIDAVTATPSTITAGGSTTLTATGRDATGGAAGDVTARTTFATTTPGASCAANTCTSTRAGSFVVTSSFAGTPGPSTTITVTAGAPAVVVAVSGGGQSATVGTTYAAPLVARVDDASGNPLAGVPVTFEAPLARGAASAVVTTGAGGTATSPPVRAAAVSPTTARATSPGASPATYALTGVAAPVVTPPAAPAADLAVRFTRKAPDWARPGSVVRVDLSLTDDGPSAAPGTRAVLRVPRGWKVLRLSAGTTRTGRVLTTRAELTPGATVPAYAVLRIGTKVRAVLRVAATSTVADPDPGNNRDTLRVRPGLLGAGRGLARVGW